LTGRALGSPLANEEEARELANGELIEALDHPIFFSFVITIVVVAWMAILTWAFKAANLPGPAALFQHP
jgi:hypothetical protein